MLLLFFRWLLSFPRSFKGNIRNKLVLWKIWLMMFLHWTIIAGQFAMFSCGYAIRLSLRANWVILLLACLIHNHRETPVTVHYRRIEILAFNSIIKKININKEQQSTAHCNISITIIYACHFFQNPSFYAVKPSWSIFSLFLASFSYYGSVWAYLLLPHKQSSLIASLSNFSSIRQ